MSSATSSSAEEAAAPRDGGRDEHARSAGASGREKQLEAECAMLRSELAAMEKLVERYQGELECAREGSLWRPRSSGSVDAYRAVEELFENQSLYPAKWSPRLHPQENMPAYCDANGNETRFTQVALPSEQWEWVSGWRCDVHAHTDEDGWMYAAAWEDLRDPTQLRHSERRIDDRVRRRRWVRERMLVSSTGLPVAVNQRMLEQSRFVAMQFANEKLSQQLLRANDRILDCEQRAKEYETHLIRLQGVVASMSNDLYSRSFDFNTTDPVAVPYVVSKSNEVLQETEKLLGDLMEGQGMARLDLAMVDVQRRRSMMVEACENEIQGAVNEFKDIVETLERRESSTSLQ